MLFYTILYYTLLYYAILFYSTLYYIIYAITLLKEVIKVELVVVLKERQRQEKLPRKVQLQLQVMKITDIMVQQTTISTISTITTTTTISTSSINITITATLGAVELFSVKYDVKAKVVTDIKKKAQGINMIMILMIMILMLMI